MEISEIKLSHGKLTFSALTAGEGPVVLLLHGFPDFAGTFEQQIPALAAAGYRVIAPNLRGYEPSSISPDKQYYQLDMAGDVTHWLDELGIEKIHLVGHDWGSIIAQSVALSAPERLLSLTIIAVPHIGRVQSVGLKHFKQVRNSWYTLFFQLRGLSDWAVKRNNYGFLEYLWRTWSPGWQWPEHQMTALKRVFNQPGVLTAALSYYRQAFDRRHEKSKRLLELAGNNIQVPTLALTGTLDGCIDCEVFKKCMFPEDFPAGLDVKEIENTGHFLHQEAPEAVNQLLLDWFGRHSENTAM